MLYHKSYITQPNYISNKAVVDFRVAVLRHAEKFGVASALNAFQVSRSTFYSWKKRIGASGGTRGSLANLAPQSTRPKTFRKSRIDAWYKEQIIALRKQHVNLGKGKIKPLLDGLCAVSLKQPISESTIGRIIADLKQLNRLPSYGRVSVNGKTGKLHKHSYNHRLKKQHRGKYMPKAPGDLIQIDCVIKFHNGIKRYIISGIDYVTSFAYSFAYTRLSSAAATDFLHKFQQVAPFAIKHIQTDNGSEFMDKFHTELERQKLAHFFNYPRHPQSNGKIERYNRTIQEEFIDPNIDALLSDITSLNCLLADWLLYYNTKRPHFSHCSLDNKAIQIPPMKALLHMLELKEEESRRWWTYTDI